MAVCVMTTGCATPAYTVRQSPLPEESASALQIERTISAYQAREFEQASERPVGAWEHVAGFELQPLVDRLSRVTERPSLHYQVSLYRDRDPNAAALADGRVYISTGMLNYLANRGSRADELAFVLGHELAHTVAQHLVKRYRTTQQQQLLMALVAAGTTVATRGGGSGAQEAGKLAMDVASLLQDVANSGYSQEQELEADQLGIRYVIRAGFHPQAALDLLQDFSRFDNPWPFLRTHPYIAIRRAYLERYLTDTGLLAPYTAEPPPPLRTGVPSASSSASRSPDSAVAERLAHLRQVQRLYPVGSVSWQNLQRQIDELDRSSP